MSTRRRLVAAPRPEPAPILARGLVPPLPVDVIDGKGDQRDSRDLSDLRVGELVKSADPLDDPLNCRVIQARGVTGVAMPVDHAVPLWVWVFETMYRSDVISDQRASRVSARTRLLAVAGSALSASCSGPVWACVLRVHPCSCRPRLLPDSRSHRVTPTSRSRPLSSAPELIEVVANPVEETSVEQEQ